MIAALLLALNVAISVLILAIGMDSRFTDIVYLWRQPGLLLRSLLAMYVLVPLVATLLVVFLDLSPGAEIALLILAVSAGAPLLPRTTVLIAVYIVTSTVITIPYLRWQHRRNRASRDLQSIFN